MEQERQLIEEYGINASTIIVMPIEYGSKIFSKVFELEEECISPFRPIEIIKESCFTFGSNYEGRKAATRKLIGAIHKVPIAISPLIYLFPTTSPDNPHCVWVAHNHVVDYKKGPQGTSTIVKFRNKHQISLPISPSSFQNQMIRTMMLKTKLLKSKEKTKSETTYESKIKKHKSAENKEDYRW